MKYEVSLEPRTRQHPDACPAFVDRQERTSLDILTMRFDSLGDDADRAIGEQVLSSDLHRTPRSAAAGREDGREVEVVRDDDELVLVLPRQDLDVWPM